MESASDSSWEVSESEEEGSQDANEEQEAIEKELPRRKNGRKSTVASWLPYNELCDIQGAVRDTMAGELQWAFRSARVHERWPLGAPRACNNTSAPAHVPHNPSEGASEYPLSGTQLAPHSCHPHPQPVHSRWNKEGSTSGEFKWPQVLHEPPAVPQPMTATRDNMNLNRADLLNLLVEEKWAAANPCGGLPLRVYDSPSLELTKALSEHLSATAFLPSLIADLERAKKQEAEVQGAAERKKHNSKMQDRMEAIHTAVEDRLQPARDELKRLHTTCLPVAATAAARADQPQADRSTHHQQMDPVELQIRAALLVDGQDWDEEEEPGPRDVDSGAADCAHSRVAEATVNAAASILNNSLAQVKYPVNSAWTRHGCLLRKDSEPKNDMLLMYPADAAEHLLAPGHAPLARNSRSPLGTVAVPASHTSFKGSAHQKYLPRIAENHAQRVQRTMAGAMPATLRALEVQWSKGDADGNACALSHMPSHPVPTHTHEQQQPTSDKQEIHSLRSLAVQLAHEWRRASSARRQADTSSPEIGGSSQAPSNAAALLDKERRVHALAKVTTWRPALVSQPVVQLLPSGTVNRLLDNAAQFRVVLEFERLFACKTAVHCAAVPREDESSGSGGTPDEEDAGQVESRSRRASSGCKHKLAKKPKATTNKRTNGKKAAAHGSPVHQNRWFAAEVPLSSRLATVFLRWPADSGPPTLLGRGARYVVRMYLRRCTGSVQPKQFLPRQLDSAFTSVPEASIHGAGGTQPERASAQAAGEDLSSWPEHDSLAFVYPSAPDAGLVCAPRESAALSECAELQGMCVARHWSTSCAFGLSCCSESAAQSYNRLPASSKSSFSPQQPSRVWALLNGKVGPSASFRAACKRFQFAAEYTDEALLSAQPVVVAAVNKKGLRANQPKLDDPVVEVMHLTQALAGRSAAADRPAANQRSAQCPWLVAAGYLGRTVAAVQPNKQEETASVAPSGTVKCDRDELEQLVARKAIALPQNSKGLAHELQRTSPAADSNGSNSQDSDVGGACDSKVTQSADENGKKNGSRGRKRPAHTEVLGFSLSEMMGETKIRKRWMMGNAVVVGRALADVRIVPCTHVTEVEEETGLDLGDVPADVTLMFRGAQASGLPVSILQRAAERWKQVMAAQNANKRQCE